MNTSPSNKVFVDTKCLSLAQLKLYHEEKLTPAEKHTVENHLLECELCSEAVAGFALLPISAMDMTDVNKRIDSISGASHSGILTSKIFLSMAATVMLSVSVFFVYRSFSKKDPVVADVNKVSTQKDLFTSGEPPKNTIVLDKKNTEVRELLQPKKSDIENKKVEEAHPNEAFTMEMLEMKSSDIILSDKKNVIDEDNLRVPVLILGNDTFILDLKITDYDKFYFVNLDNLKPIRQGTDPMFENTKDRDNNGVYKLQEWEVTTTAQVLRSALVKFNSQQYDNAAKLFNVLAKHNENDVNALFYGGVCYFNMSNYEKALDYFTRVLSNANGSFYEEAKWYKAQTYLKKHDVDNARKLFAEIVSENGFYKEQAKEKLKGL